MTSMVERVAKAIFENAEHRVPWEDCDKYMFKLDGENVIYHVNGLPNASPQDIDWNKRSDAALKEGA